MTDANRILEAAAKADHAGDIPACWTPWEELTDIPERYDVIRPVVVAVLRELSKSYDEYTEGVIGDELSELADEIEGNSDG